MIDELDPDQYEGESMDLGPSEAELARDYEIDKALSRALRARERGETLPPDPDPEIAAEVARVLHAMDDVGMSDSPT